MFGLHDLSLLPVIETHVRVIPDGTAGTQHVSDSNGDEWLIKPVARRQLGVLPTISEYVAGSLIDELELPIPLHAPVLLPERLVRAEANLRAFTPGPVLGVRYMRGVALNHARTPGSSSPLANLDPVAGQGVALATAATDTWLWNADRSPGSFSRNRISSNEGNLYLQEPTVPGGAWHLTLIDYDYAFCGPQWGSGSNGEWPVAVLGTMRYFFENRYLPFEADKFISRADPLLRRIEALDMRATIGRIVNNTPNEWLDGTHGSPILQNDFDDLSRRLDRQARLLRNTFESHFGLAVKAWGGVI